MTINDMNQPPHSNYVAPNGFAPFSQNESTWRDSSPWLQPPIFGSTTIPVFGSWKSSNDSASNPVILNEPVAECVILDEDPHQPQGIKQRLLPPPPPPPYFINNYHVLNPPSLTPNEVFFFNQPSAQSYSRSKSVSDLSQSSSPADSNFDPSSRTPSNRHTPVHFNNDTFPEIQKYSVSTKNSYHHTQFPHKLPSYNNERSLSRMSDHYDFYRSHESTAPRKQRTSDRHRVSDRYRDKSPLERHRSVDRYIERSSLSRDDSDSSLTRRNDNRSYDKTDTSRRNRNNEERRKSSRRHEDFDESESRITSERRKEENETKESSRRRHRVADESKSSRRHRDRSQSISRSHRHADQENSGRRREKSPLRVSHRSRHSSSPRKRSRSKRRDESQKERVITDNNEEIQSSMDLQLQAYALELGDPDVLREKLAQKMIEKKKRDAALASSGQQQNSEKNVKSSHVGNITLYYDTSNAHALTGQNEESLSDTEENDENNCETIGAAYPWYRNAPMQHEIGEKFLNSSDTIYNERPQKPVESNRVMRTFPKRSKTVKEYPNGVSPGSDIHIHNQHVESVKDVGGGYVVKRPGSTSWVAKTSMSTAAVASFAAKQKSFQKVTGGRTACDSDECFEYSKTKSCQAGGLCKYKHNGCEEHQRVKFCRRYMNGFCRNGNNCVRGSHALLPHQLPVCGYYLRASCTFVEGCPFLHVKNSAKSALCIHFNKGKCLAEFPCGFIHLYCPTVIRERCSSENDDDFMDSTEEEHRFKNFDDIPRLQWFEE